MSAKRVSVQDLVDGRAYLTVTPAIPDFEDEPRNGETQDPLNAAIHRSIARDEGEKQTGVTMYKRIKNLIRMVDHWTRINRRRVIR